MGKDEKDDAFSDKEFEYEEEDMIHPPLVAIIFLKFENPPSNLTPNIFRMLGLLSRLTFS